MNLIRGGVSGLELLAGLILRFPVDGLFRAVGPLVLGMLNLLGEIAGMLQLCGGTQTGQLLKILRIHLLAGGQPTGHPVGEIHRLIQGAAEGSDAEVGTGRLNLARRPPLEIAQPDLEILLGRIEDRLVGPVGGDRCFKLIFAHRPRLGMVLNLDLQSSDVVVDRPDRFLKFLLALENLAAGPLHPLRGAVIGFHHPAELFLGLRGLPVGFSEIVVGVEGLHEIRMLPIIRPEPPAVDEAVEASPDVSISHLLGQGIHLSQRSLQKLLLNLTLADLDRQVHRPQMARRAL